MTEVYVLPVYENGQETRGLATSNDGSNWELRDTDCQVRGPITLSVAMSSDIALSRVKMVATLHVRKVET